MTVRSDLYSLGLVLYELFTGKQAFAGTTPAQRLKAQKELTPTHPSSHVEDLDPAVERVILRCLEREPRNRPLSALSVAAALPGGDPLAAALAAGETPSPELVAEAGQAGGLRPLYGWVCLVGIAVLVALQALFMEEGAIQRRVPFDRAPEVLAESARDILRMLGLGSERTDTTQGFSYDRDYLSYLAKEGGEDPYAPLATAEQGAVRFWYRESPVPLLPHRLASMPFTPRSFDPPLTTPGMVMVRLDLAGRLRALEVVPPVERNGVEIRSGPNWAFLFSRAGLDIAEFAPVSARWNPPTFADAVLAWEAAARDGPGSRLRVEAASYAGDPVSFRVVEPWMPSPVVEENPWGRPSDVSRSSWGSLFHVSVMLLAILAAALLARRNMRLKRGDRRAAFRLALFMFSLVMLHWVFGAHHTGGAPEVDLLFGALYTASFTFGLVWILYMALEPYARRFWPESMVTWVRVLNGRFRDPLVGRDVLLGCVLGALWSVMFAATPFLAAWLGGSTLPNDSIMAKQLDPLQGMSSALSITFLLAHDNLKSAVVFIMTLLLLRLLLRRTSLAVGIAFVIALVVYGGTMYLANAFIYWVLWFLALLRLGWVPVVVGMFFSELLFVAPLGFELSHWTAPPTVLAVVLLAAVSAYAFKTALGGRQALGSLFAEV